MSSLISSIVNLFVKAFCGSQEEERPQQQQQQAQPPVSYPPQHHHQQQPPYKPHEQEGGHGRPQHGGQVQGHKPHNDYLANSQDPAYKSLRDRADALYAEKRAAAQASQQAYHAGDGARAKELSQKKEELEREAERLNAQAADVIFRLNNNGREGVLAREVDLHGLFVKEAVEKTERAVREAKGRGEREVRLIVGKGLHSQNHDAKIKPAIEELMQRENLVAEIDADNTGVLIVYLDGETRNQERAIGPDELTRQLTRDGGDRDKSCIIM